MKLFVIIWSCVLLVTAIVANKLPSELKTCKRSDANFNECLRNAIQDSLSVIKNGVPSLNFPPIEPVEIEALSIAQGTGAVHFDQHYKNIKIYGITSAKLDTTKYDFDADILYLHATVDELRFEADYDVDGKILVMPIVGKGKATIKLLNSAVSITIKTKHYNKKGVDYSNIDDVLIDIEPRKMEVQFDNLFDGDKVLGEQMNNMVNDNWRDVFKDVKHGYEEALGAVFKSTANQIYGKIPVNDMFPL